MKLSKLEIKGFKSFAERIVINFDDGITGIVGPNGCGKSNIVDAIRWVLGEQKSRILRSENMGSVIFNGTKSRKPTQLAEVSLTFDNTKNIIPTEYTQVTVTRKYYRSGESDYMLNGVNCRLKDITNLFLNTGISSNNYAIIELKMVDDLLNDKENSRRFLFEEAAGISKFKIRKKETLKKLNNTDDDLERVKDLLFEIDKNLKSLEKQATLAKKYYEIKDTYKKSSIAFGKKLMNNQLDEFNVIKKEVDALQNKKIELNVVTQKIESEIEKAKTDLIQSEKLLASNQKMLNEFVNTIRQYESDKKIKNERQKFLQEKIENLKKQIHQDRLSSEQTVINIESLQKEMRKEKTELSEISLHVDKIKKEYDQKKTITNHSQIELEALNSLYSKTKEHYFQLSKELEIKEIQRKSINQELNKTSEDSTQNSASIEAFQDKLSEITKEKEHINNQFEKLKIENDKTEKLIKESEKKILEEKEERSQINRLLDAKQNEFNLTKSLVDNLEGFPEAIRFLKKNDEWKDAPLLSDIISCPENYRVCIENFLEPFMNYFVVETLESAINGIHLLSDSASGKVNFFVLNNLKQYYNTLSENQDLGLNALDIVTFDEKYRNLISYLLGNVFIYENSEHINHGFTSTCIDNRSKIIYSPYSMSGGSIGLFEGKRIGRAKNLELLEIEIESLKEAQKNIDVSIEKIQSYIATLMDNSKIDSLENVKEELSAINEMSITLTTKQDQFAEMLSSNKNRKKDIQSQLEIITKEIHDLTPQINNQKEELKKLEETLIQKRTTLLDFQEESEKISSYYNEQNVFFHRKQNKLNSLVQEISFKEESYQQTSLRNTQNKEDLKIASENLTKLISKSVQNDDDLVGMYEKKDELDSNVNDAEKKYYAVRNRIIEEEKKIRVTQNDREKIEHSIVEWQNKLNDLKISLNSVKDRISVEFNIDLEKISEDEVHEFKDVSEDILKEKIEKFRNKIGTMGPINPMAMDAYEEIKERHSFISEQKEDLLKAKESLLSTIEEIDEVAKETFLKTFNEIKINFIKVFRTLFTNEDDCDLILLNPDNPLESTIDIIAKPKGKRPVSINQLSGGEKTLTATSLLFSIYLIKPSPFCIFDEVDAPLDDANIDKFNKIIRTFSKDSQFIIVTHNKRTMSSTDIIYGVTMQEEGVSKVLPVDLRKLA